MSKKPQQQKKSMQPRIPTVHVFVASCGPRTCIPVRVDLRMTVETLRETAANQYQVWCQDEGIAYNPPSLLSSEYDVFPCIDESGDIEGRPGLGTVNGNQGVNTLSAFGVAATAAGDAGAIVANSWLETSRGGTTVREQLSMLIPPVFCSMVIGQRWSERNDLVLREAEARNIREERRFKLMEELRQLSDVSRDKHRSMQLFRERQSAVVSKVEEALLTAATEYRLHEDQIAREHKLLKEGYCLWKATVGGYQRLYEAIVQKKRMMWSVSQSAVALEHRIQ